jgi:hypothetical protein
MHRFRPQSSAWHGLEHVLSPKIFRYVPGLKHMAKAHFYAQRYLDMSLGLNTWPRPTSTPSEAQNVGSNIALEPMRC